jgi:hypothetical protein
MIALTFTPLLLRNEHGRVMELSLLSFHNSCETTKRVSIKFIRVKPVSFVDQFLVPLTRP